jgi:hypothetical protein
MTLFLMRQSLKSSNALKRSKAAHPLVDSATKFISILTKIKTSKKKEK